ncbi:MAG: MATE family efflux transporter [Bacilli bacterium]|nr:MATE family efflux transporter [Bacilli bacterium]
MARQGLLAKLGNLDMTKGNLFGKLILFAFPLALASMMQLLYTTIDIVSVRFGDSGDAAASVSANGSLINLIIVLFNNIALGSNVLVANAKGAGDREKAQRVLHTSLLFALFAGIGVGILGFFVAPELLKVMNTSEHLIDNATRYLKIYFLGLPFLMVYNYCAQMLRAQGDSRSPFLILTLAGIINVGFDLLFVFPMKMGVAGVAFATIIAEAISAFLAILTFRVKKESFLRLNFKSLRIDGKAMKELLIIGVPAGLQGFFFSLPNVFLQAKLYTIDPTNDALENGAIAAGNVESYLFAGIDAIAMATMSFVAQNHGAKKGKNIKKVFFFGLSWGIIYYAVAFTLVLLTGRHLLRLFVDNEASLDPGMERLMVMSSTYFLNAFMGVSAGALRGLKHSTYPMVVTLLCCTVFRIIYLETIFTYVPFFHTVTWLYALFPITWGMAAVCNLSAAAYFLPRDIKKMEMEENPIPAENSL